MSFANACEEWDLHEKAKIMAQTWGHLYPIKDRIYTGTIHFCRGAYGDITVIESQFDNALDCSPQRYGAEHDIAYEVTDDDGVFKWCGSISFDGEKLIYNTTAFYKYTL